MLRIDFGQCFLDHRSILVLVKKLGSVKEDEFSQLFDDISQLRTVELANSRTVYLRYTRHISHQFVDWGSFHTHKKLLGILSIARCSGEKDLISIKAAHESLKTWYSNTTLDSRCFLLGCEKSKDEKKKPGEFVFLNQDNIMKEIEDQVANYAMSLFLVLESKRMDKSLEKPEKVTLLRSPIDGDGSVDGENRNRKQCIGRMKKYMGDLSLVAGLPQEAVFHYSVGIDLLRAAGDVLWLCGCMEGLCAASLLSRTEKMGSSLERPSLQLNVDQLSIAGPVNGMGGDGEDLRLTSAIPLTDEEIIEKSDEIFQGYQRHKDSRVLGIEARFKYARFFISKKRYREASNALQDVLSSEFSLSDAEKIQQYSAMSIMYEDIGFMRKAAFFTRMASLHCTSQHLPLQGWTASYNLLRNALDGYKINFHKNTQEGITEGWPDLQITLMEELIKMSEELQSPDIPVRHISYLLHVMYKHMDENDILDLITSLERLAGSLKNCSLIHDLVLSNGDKLPPVSLTTLPVVRTMKVNVLASHLRPFVSPLSPVKTPFIFSTLNKKSKTIKKSSPVVNWVEGDVGEVTMQVFNPMPFDVKVGKMMLLTEGVPFEAFPSCLALSNDGMSHPFMLLGIPHGHGQLNITGYSVEVFGVQSNCPISETILDNPLDLPLIVNVTPTLPLVQFQCSIPGVKSSVNSSHKGSSLFLDVTLYNGQIITGPIIVENVGKIPMETISITILNTFKSDHGNMVMLLQDHIISSLPLQPATNTHFDLEFYGLHHGCHGDRFNSSGKMKVTYGGGAAWKQGKSRQAAIDFKIEVFCSLHCSYYSITADDDQLFELSMDIQNQTTVDVEWRFEVKDSSQDETLNMLPAGVTTRASVILEKFDLSKTDTKGSECERCTEKLVELIKLHWRIPHKISGVVNLDGLKLDQEMVNTLRKYRFTCEMMLNGLNVERDAPFVVEATTPILVTVKVSNCSDNEVNASILNIEPFQVGENGVHVFEVKPKICWIGSCSTLLPKIAVGGSAVHSCGFIFLCAGQYFINLRCFDKQRVDNEQYFRGRTQVIKGGSFENRRSRSSRAESFTESLLLRQRSYSSPLAKLSYSAIINVVQDDNTNATECSFVDNDDHEGETECSEDYEKQTEYSEDRGKQTECSEDHVDQTDCSEDHEEQTECSEDHEEQMGCSEDNEEHRGELGQCEVIRDTEGVTGTTIEGNQQCFTEDQNQENETINGVCIDEDFQLSHQEIVRNPLGIMDRVELSGDSTMTVDGRITFDCERNERLNEQLNEDEKRKVEETKEDIVEEKNEQADDQETQEAMSSSANNSKQTNSEETSDVVSPSVQERIVFFNSN